MDFNTRNTAVKRLMKEANEMVHATEQYFAQPIDDNLFEWHFTFRGLKDSDFHGGIYHGRIIFPSEYPMKPPSFMFLTENGRFEINTKICLSISGHHPETWQPSWSTRTAILAIMGFMNCDSPGAIGAIAFPSEMRQFLAKKTIDFKCKSCGHIKNLLLPIKDNTLYTNMVTESAKIAAEMSNKDKLNKIELPESKFLNQHNKSYTHDKNTTPETTPPTSSSDTYKPEQDPFITDDHVDIRKNIQILKEKTEKMMSDQVTHYKETCPENGAIELKNETKEASKKCETPPKTSQLIPNIVILSSLSMLVFMISFRVFCAYTFYFSN